MKGFYKMTEFIIYILLLFNGIGAVYGGYHFITDPSGSSLGMDTSYLKTGPFTDYLIPGILLIFFNGLCSFITLWFMVKKYTFSRLFLSLQGLILLAWIVTQIFVLQMVYPAMHYTFLCIAVFFILCGVFLNQTTIKQANKPS